MIRTSGFQLHLVRHGESANNALPENQRVADPALTTLGEKQARQFGSHYASIDRLDHVLASPFRRTLQTAQPLLNARSIRADIWPDIYEVGGCFGGYEPDKLSGEPGMSDIEIRSEFPEFNVPDEIDKNGWYKRRAFETWDVAVARAESQAKKLRDHFEHTDSVVFCFIHADFKQLLLQQLVPDQRAFHRGGILNSSVTHIRFENGKGNVIDYCNTDHLMPGDESY